MFKIYPIQDISTQQRYARLCGTEVRVGAFAYAMADSKTQEPMGFAQFEITASGGVLYDLRPVVGLNDFEAMFILGRATMNFIDTCGCHTISATNESADEKLLKAIGLRTTDGYNFHCDMTGFFDGSHCKGHNEVNT